MDNKVKKTSRKGKGIVVSNKMEKTLVVEVVKFKTHSKYNKKYKDTTRYKVHDENGLYKVGDVVEFIECAPISKDKRRTVLEGVSNSLKVSKKKVKKTSSDKKKVTKEDK